MTTEEKTATLRVGRWSSTCSACGGNADPNETHHVKGGPKSMWDADSSLGQANGCRARFTEKRSDYV
jgi:hypothetical protein